ncbi:hypothetical protein BDV93DRAFT_525131 [Ceratobasidium sp. AG-I]|nr:hypothetical protein BDV93DRAFT_525131 [Ceratobasidium sp. AG-I]
MLDLSSIPSDIYAIILSFVPPLDRQKAILNLSRALPRSPVPTHQIYEHIIIHTPRAVLYIYQRFRKLKSEQGALYNPSEQVKSLSVRTWIADADLVVNLFAIMPSVPVIQLFVGTTYSPEHLNDVFTKPRLSLRVLQLRFKPYVERATYMPFLKGAYFDSTIVQLTKWPATQDKHLTALSITQDTISYKAHIKFAQPLAFFSFTIISDLATSPIGQYVKSLRISVPAKPVAGYLSARPNSFPRLKFLDISTTNLPPPSAERAIEGVLGQLIRLEHIIIDRNAGHLPRDSPGWAGLGRACALAGVGRAKQREKDIQAWVDAKMREEAIAQAANAEDAAAAELLGPAQAPAPAVTLRPRRGRRGLATATISLRDREHTPIRSVPSAPNPASSSSDGPPPRRIRVVPSPPTLRTFSTAYAGPSNPTTHQRTDWGKAFVQGYLDGCRTLNAIWKRMQDTATVRVMRFTDTDVDPYPDDDDAPAALRGVADISIVGHWIGWEPVVPIICFGTERFVRDQYDDAEALSNALWQMGVEQPGVDGGSVSVAETSSQSEHTSVMSGSITPATSISSAGPSAVGGLWEEEEFIEWGPGHADECGHSIGRDIFD